MDNIVCDNSIATLKQHILVMAFKLRC